MPKFNKNQYTLKQVYAHYKERVKDPVEYKEHKDILDLWGDKVVDVLLEGKDIRIGSGLSVLCIRKKKKPTYVNFKESKEKGRKIKSSNAHSGFYIARVVWRRHYTRINSSNWSFEPCRTLQRKLSEIMKTYLGHTRFTQQLSVTIKSKN
tara:strand:- start:895 stop:1344 length:450 start_codon:yes stop_codon:yes gene_type:complete